MDSVMTKERAMEMGLTCRKDEILALPYEELQAGYLMFNIPNPETPNNPNGEGVWGWADPESKARYNDDHYTGKLTVVLCNDPMYYSGVLCEGMEVVVRCNGEHRPILDPEWVQEKLIDTGLYTPPQPEQENDDPASRMREICASALETWGPEAQTLMVFEEMAELQKELCKHARGLGDRSHIAEEIADVEIMLEQMKILHDCEELVKGLKEYKLTRLAIRIAGERNAREKEEADTE